MLNLSRILIVLGILFLLIGGLIYLAARFNLPLGRLPGDIRIEKDNFRLYLPLGSSLLISLILSLVLSILFRLWKK